MQPKASILLVDDEPRNLEVLAAILDSPDYELVMANSAQEALLAILQREFAAIVTDIKMPGISGLELAQIIKQRKRTEAVPILFLTAHLLEETDVLRGYSAGAVDYLSKPINPEIMRSKIGVFVELSRKNQALAAVNLALQNEVRERERAEEALRFANTDLENRVNERTIELQAHRERLEDLVASRTHALEVSHERLRQAERLAAVGTLAAGLGHDMSNLLLPIRARIAGMSDSALDPSLATDVQSISEAVGYLQRLASGLRLLAVDPDRVAQHHATTLLEGWWKDVEGIFRAGVPRHVRLESVIPSGLPPVAIHSARLTQAVFNLIQNAGEAMGSRPLEHGSTLHVVNIAASVHPVQEPGADVPRATGTNVVVSISDNGPGMSPEVARRCFEPYFSTKIRAVSTGMGLTLVRAWIDGAGGSITVDTAPGRGTTFVITLPVAADALGSEDRTPNIHAAMSVSDRRIASLVSSMVETASVVLDDWTGKGPPQADVWIVSATPARVLRDFLTQNHRRQALVFAQRTESDVADLQDASNTAGRVRYVGATPRVAELRVALKDVFDKAAGVNVAEHAATLPYRSEVRT